MDITSKINIQWQCISLVCADEDRLIADSEGMVQWSVIEICVGIVVACMPHARQLAGSLVRHISTKERGENSSSTKGIFPERAIGTIAMTP